MLLNVGTVRTALKIPHYCSFDEDSPGQKEERKSNVKCMNSASCFPILNGGMTVLGFNERPSMQLWGDKEMSEIGTKRRVL